MPEERAMDAALAKLYDADRDVQEACGAARLSKVGPQSVELNSFVVASEQQKN